MIQNKMFNIFEKCIIQNISSCIYDELYYKVKFYDINLLKWIRLKMQKLGQVFRQILPLPQSIAQMIKAQAFLIITPNKNPSPSYTLPTIVRCLEFESEQQAIQNQIKFTSFSNAFHLSIINSQVKYLVQKNVWGLILQIESPKQSFREKLYSHLQTGTCFTQSQLIMIINCINCILQNYSHKGSAIQSFTLSQIIDLMFVTQQNHIKLARPSLLAPSRPKLKSNITKSDNVQQILKKLSIFIFQVLTFFDKRDILFNSQITIEKIKALQFKTFAMKSLKDYLLSKISDQSQSKRLNSIHESSMENKFPEIRCLKSSKKMHRSQKKRLQSPSGQESQRKSYESGQKSRKLNQKFMTLNEMANDKIVQSFQQDEYSYILQSNNSSPSRILPNKGYQNAGLLGFSPQPSLNLFSPSQPQHPLSNQTSRSPTSEIQLFQLRHSLSNSKSSNLQNSNLNSIILEVEEESNYEILEASSHRSDIIELSFSQKTEDGPEVRELQDLQNGTKYFGEVVHGMKHGRGKMFYLDGGFYEGQWKDNTIFGFGRLFYPSSKLAYAGYWKDGCFHGPGLVLNEEVEALNDFDYTDFSNLGRVWISYRGNFNMDVREGFGVVKLSNGDSIAGNWEGNCLNGEAQYKRQDGSVMKGVWKMNKLEKIIKQDI